MPRATPPSTRRAPLSIPDPRVSERVQRFPESVIREMTRIADLHGAVNLAQGFPDFDPPAEVVRAAQEAIGHGANQYSVTWGTPGLREAIVQRAHDFNRIDADADRNVVVTCGATEAMMAAMISIVDPGDEVIVTEPFYENYGPDAIVSGAVARHVMLEWPDWHLDEEELKRAFNSRTKAIVVNTPNNPSGRVLTRSELRLIGDLTTDHDVVAITDEIYEHIVYDGRRHVSLASLDGMAERTITINGISKTYSATGWRVGWAIAPTPLATAMRRAHDFLTVCAPNAFQVGAEVALGLPESYYTELALGYERKRDRFVRGLQVHGLACTPPEGAYYVMADISEFPFANDWDFANALVERCGLACVPGSSFYRPGATGARFVRFVFAKKESTLDLALERLEGLEQLRTPPSEGPASAPARRARTKKKNPSPRRDR
jgi:L-glutamine---4-(methylsulfanyl)-2-oxobutanoate aminotransferase